MRINPVVVMGVSGSGKSTIGEALAEQLGWPFKDGDELHPAVNIAKMAGGVPLVDADRRPWLEACGQWLEDRRAEGRSSVLACSALKRSYRDVLRAHVPDLRILHLDADRELLLQRIGHRTGHFFPGALLDAQLADLEPPQPGEDAIILPVTMSVPDLVEAAAKALTERSSSAGDQRS
jgi:gluconokinase